MSDDALRKEISKIVKESASLATNIATVSKNDKATPIASIGSAAVGIVTDVINAFSGGMNGDILTSLTKNSSKILTTSLKLLDKDKLLKDTKFGDWLGKKAAGTKIESFVNNELGKNITTHIGTAVNTLVGVYSVVNTYLDSAEKYNIAGLPKSSANINKAIEVITDITHTAGNAVALGLTGGKLTADEIFKMMSLTAATIVWSFESSWARLTGGDASKVPFRWEDKNFAEVIGDSLKNLITGTTNKNNVTNEKDRKKIYTTNDGDNNITNYGSYCTINSDVGNDYILNQAGSKANYVDGGNDNDVVVIYGTSNTVLGGRGNDDITLLSDGKIPASGNKLYGESGNDYIAIDDTKYPTLPRKGNNTIIGGKGNDSLWGNSGADTFIYSSGDGKDIIYGFDNKDTLTLDSLDFTTAYSKKDKAVMLNFDNGSITLKNFTATTFYINNDTYKISDSQFKKL